MHPGADKPEADGWRGRITLIVAVLVIIPIGAPDIV
jgi:hypothetical protein